MKGEGVAKKKIAILGGGAAALSAAFGLTEKPGWKDQYEITVYQLGWRLGGKGGAAELLGMKRTTLYAKIKKLGIER